MCSFRIAESSDFEHMGSGGQQTKHELAPLVRTLVPALARESTTLFKGRFFTWRIASRTVANPRACRNAMLSASVGTPQAKNSPVLPMTTSFRSVTRSLPSP